MNNEEVAKEIVRDGVFVSRVTYSTMEISLYRFDGNPMEIWFDISLDFVRHIRNLRDIEINPYLKYIAADFREN